MWSYLPFMSFLFNFFSLSLCQFFTAYWRQISPAQRRAPGLNSLGTENAPTAKPQPYPDPQLHYTGSTSPSQGESQIARVGWKEILSVPYCPWEAVAANWYPSNKAITIRISALCVKPLRNLEIRNLPKGWPWLPFSQARIISDENIWMFSPFQFHFQSIFGYELKKSAVAVKLPKNQLQFKQAAERMWIKLKGPLERCP